MKKPPLSVRAVIITEEPSAGSRPRRNRVRGMSTPAIADSTRFSVIAPVMTRASDTFSYSQYVIRPSALPQMSPFSNETPSSFVSSA